MIDPVNPQDKVVVIALMIEKDINIVFRSFRLLFCVESHVSVSCSETIVRDVNDGSWWIVFMLRQRSVDLLVCVKSCGTNNPGHPEVSNTFLVIRGKH